MKCVYILWLLSISLFAPFAGHSQTGNATAIVSEIRDVTLNRTTVLIFPANIKRVDLGSADIVAKTVKLSDGERVLRLKAAKEDFEPASMHVFTDDGKVYPFTVRYAAQLLIDTWDYSRGPSLPEPSVQAGSGRMHDAAVREQAIALLGKPRMMKRPKSVSFGMKLQMQGVYVKDGVIFFQLLVRNSSDIPYYVDFCRFYIRDQKTAKRTSLMESEIQPLYLHYATGAHVLGKKSQRIVVAFDLFTITEKKLFVLELYEKNGDRHLQCRLKGKHLMRAVPLPGKK